MKATLLMFALSATETQLELRGTYEPPMGRLGEVLDAAAGHRLAGAAVTRFIREVAGWLREQLAAPAAVASKPASQPTVASKPASQPMAVDMEC